MANKQKPSQWSTKDQNGFTILKKKIQPKIMTKPTPLTKSLRTCRECSKVLIKDSWGLFCPCVDGGFHQCLGNQCNAKVRGSRNMCRQHTPREYNRNGRVDRDDAQSTECRFCKSELKDNTMSWPHEPVPTGNARQDYVALQAWRQQVNQMKNQQQMKCVVCQDGKFRWCETCQDFKASRDGYCPGCNWGYFSRVDPKDATKRVYSLGVCAWDQTCKIPVGKKREYCSHHFTKARHMMPLRVEWYKE